MAISKARYTSGVHIMVKKLARILLEKDKQDALIGENMSEERADVRVMTGLSRIDRDKCFVADYEVDSEADKKCKSELCTKK